MYKRQTAHMHEQPLEECKLLITLQVQATTFCLTEQLLVMMDFFFFQWKVELCYSALLCS